MGQRKDSRGRRRKAGMSVILTEQHQIRAQHQPGCEQIEPSKAVQPKLDQAPDLAGNDGLQAFNVPQRRDRARAQAGGGRHEQRRIKRVTEVAVARLQQTKRAMMVRIFIHIQGDDGDDGGDGDPESQRVAGGEQRPSWRRRRNAKPKINSPAPVP